MKFIFLLRALRCCLGWFALSLAVTFLVLAATLGIFAVLVLTAPALTERWGSAVGLFLFGVGLPLTFALAAAAHEAGHVLAGAGVGFEPTFAHVGPITCTRGIGGWRLGWDWRKPWLGGRAVCILRGRGRWQTAMFLLGGPLANLGSSLIAVGFAASGLPVLMRCWLGLFAIHSLFLGIVNLFPLRERWLDSDGLALWRLFTLREGGQQFHLPRSLR